MLDKLENYLLEKGEKTAEGQVNAGV